MNYLISNDFVSTRALYSTESLAHGFTWGKHKYIRKEGNRYIYPEDLEARRRSRNDVGATLFGDRNKRNELRTLTSYTKKLERYKKKADRKAETSRRMYMNAYAESQNYTKSEAYRKRKLDEYNKYKQQRVDSIAASKKLEANIEAGRKAVEYAKVSYDRSRKIDDIPKNVLDTGAAYLNAAARWAFSFLPTKKTYTRVFD